MDSNHEERLRAICRDLRGAYVELSAIFENFAFDCPLDTEAYNHVSAASGSAKSAAKFIAQALGIPAEDVELDFDSDFLPRP